MDVKEKIKEYWDSRCMSYDRSPGHVAFPELWKDFLAGLLERKMRILDVGTGTGFIALLLAELGYEVVGLDISEGMLRVARDKARKAGVDVDFQVGDAENLPFDNESFDAVISRHLLWTLPNPKKAVEEWVRVVRKGGRVIAIDGKWLTTSTKAKLRRFIGRIGIAIYERRIPWRGHYSREINSMLPFYGGSEPEKIVELFGSVGLVDISVVDLRWMKERMLENQPLVYRFAWSKEYFAVTGFKEVIL
ncbi:MULTISPECIES: class I SAM-dependent methyltransferase [unclassified Archaeoglobus]|jgi:ubiquinone/menaquinone biosynthesis C-methylase UbiE|uniref:class I SAM-dependent methyltransferase n=1 Tax=unclassified Archaeoglobus TaxID=2643606 RepID=UPI0025B9097F|nr:MULTISPECIES: class I SAM-dependent methyltransferase [unclassified Archaeoglobus]